MIEDEWVALTVYASTALISLALFVRGNIKELRWDRHRRQSVRPFIVKKAG